MKHRVSRIRKEGSSRSISLIDLTDLAIQGAAKATLLMSFCRSELETSSDVSTETIPDGFSAVSFHSVVKDLYVWSCTRRCLPKGLNRSVLERNVETSQKNPLWIYSSVGPDCGRCAQTRRLGQRPVVVWGRKRCRCVTASIRRHRRTAGFDRDRRDRVAEGAMTKASGCRTARTLQVALYRSLEKLFEWKTTGRF